MRAGSGSAAQRVIVTQGQFVGQWKWTGKVNSHIEEMFTGHELVKVLGHRTQAIEEFDCDNEQMYDASFRAQFISGIIQPAMMFISNLNYVAIAVIGGIRVASGTMSLGDMQAFIQYSRQITMPITQLASITTCRASVGKTIEGLESTLPTKPATKS